LILITPFLDSLYRMIPGMILKGGFWNYASTERFYHSLKSERLPDCKFATRKSEHHEMLEYKRQFAYEKG
jgi:hypothetical protein